MTKPLANPTNVPVFVGPILDRLIELWGNVSGPDAPRVAEILALEFPGIPFTPEAVRAKVMGFKINRHPAYLKRHGGFSADTVWFRALHRNKPEDNPVKRVAPGTFPAKGYRMALTPPQK